jgi:hypothetical protein
MQTNPSGLRVYAREVIFDFKQLQKCIGFFGQILGKMLVKCLKSLEKMDILKNIYI